MLPADREECSKDAAFAGFIAVKQPFDMYKYK